MFQPVSDISRRGFLRGGIGLAAFVLPRAVAAVDDAPRRVGRAKSVIVLLLEGGMSHLETWDPKPNAPAEIRGSFAQIQTTNPELIVGEHIPRLARQAHLYNIVRSVYTHNARRDHSPGLHWVLTGFDNQAAGVALMNVNKDPSVGSIVAHELGSLTRSGLPNFIAIPDSTQLGGRVDFNGSLHLGAVCQAFVSGPVPQRADGHYALPAGLTLPGDLPQQRLNDRRALLQALDELRRNLDQSATWERMSNHQRHAFDLLLGKSGRAAFDINQEPAPIREAYGNSTMGQGTLLARRLVEAGVSYVLVNFSKNNSWDTHRDNFARLKNTLLPPMDQAASALLADLEQRDMLDDVLVLMLGEMGRTPLINNRSGRDHWTDVWSVMIAGGGLARGQILGSTTSGGEYAASRPVHLHEILATVYYQLGIDPNLAIIDDQLRPVRILPEADPVGELILA